MEEIGTGFQHPAVQYHRQSIENTDLPSESYDLVFAVATMEHVPDIRAGFREMARLTRKNGLMFSEASPLWQSPSGHHMGCFPAYPWIHLLFPHPAELAIYARNQGITGERGHTIEAIAEYMLCPDNFNMLPGTDYVAACADLPGMRLVENRLCRGDAAPLHTEFGQRALKAGYTTENLAAVQHRVIARKG
jgi:SAM-dependent methyltransferase